MADTIEAWRLRAECIDWHPETFFEDVWPTEEDPSGPNLDQAKLAQCRTVCSRCPVRRECYADVMEMEKGAAAEMRFGIRAGMTPAQRWSAEHRKAVKCPRCGATLDPDAVRAGEITCVNWCDIDRTMPEIDDRGDRWTRRHTTLARKVLRWIVEEGIDAGAQLPRPSALADQWRDRRNDMIRVFEAFVADGTLALVEGEYVFRGLAGAFTTWVPAHLQAA